MRLSHLSRLGLRTALGLIVAISQIATLAPAQAEPVSAPSPAGPNTTDAPSVQQPAAPAPPKWLMRTLNLEAVAYAIGTANADRCERPIMATGLVLHDISSYDADARPAIAERFGLGMGFGILGVVPGSGADLAGLRAGDEIVGMDGIDLEHFGHEAISTRGQHDRLNLLTALIDTKLRQPSFQLQVRNRDGVRTTTLVGAPACGGRIAYVQGGPINAWSDGENVAVTEDMLQFLHNDDELAFVVAHEIAHNLLHHGTRPGRPPSWLALFAIGSVGIKRDEVAADEYAVDLLDRTRFDARRAIPMVRRTAPLVFLDFGMTHPGVARRVDIIETRMAFFANQHRAVDAWFDLTRYAAEQPVRQIPLDSISRTMISAVDTESVFGKTGAPVFTLKPGIGRDL